MKAHVRKVAARQARPNLKDTSADPEFELGLEVDGNPSADTGNHDCDGDRGHTQDTQDTSSSGSDGSGRRPIMTLSDCHPPLSLNDLYVDPNTDSLDLGPAADATANVGAAATAALGQGTSWTSFNDHWNDYDVPRLAARQPTPPPAPLQPSPQPPPTSASLPSASLPATIAPGLTLPAKPPIQGAGANVKDDILRLEAFVRLIVLNGMSVNAASRHVGWSATTGYRVVDQPAYLEARAELIAEVRQTRDQAFQELDATVSDTAIVGARRINTLIRDPKGNIDIVAREANKAMDRIGYRAPERAETRVQVELSRSTVDLLARALDLGPKAEASATDANWDFARQPTDAMSEPGAVVGTATHADSDADSNDAGPSGSDDASNRATA